MILNTVPPFAIVWFLFLIVGTSAQSQICLDCMSEKYLNPSFSNDDRFENIGCERGDTDSVDATLCGYNEVCSTIDGIASYNVHRYGEHETKFVARGCIDRAEFRAGTQCMSRSEANAYMRGLNHNLEVGEYEELVAFDGSVCFCDTEDYCNNRTADPIVIRRSHTPSPGARGIQCATCLDIDFGFSYNHYDYNNPSCVTGDLSDDQVYYNTCGGDSGDGVCALIDGTFEEFGVPYQIYQRTCVYGLADYLGSTDDLQCVSRSLASELVPQLLSNEDYYTFGDDTTFDGNFCFCSSDFCTLPGRRVPVRGGGGDSAATTTSARPLAVALMLYASRILLR